MVLYKTQLSTKSALDAALYSPEGSCRTFWRNAFSSMFMLPPLRARIEENSSRFVTLWLTPSMMTSTIGLLYRPFSAPIMPLIEFFVIKG
jgi:hypothetical protein